MEEEIDNGEMALDLENMDERVDEMLNNSDEMEINSVDQLLENNNEKQR